MSKLEQFQEKLANATSNYSQWREEVESVVEEIKAVEEEMGVSVTQDNGWNSFNSNEFDHYFLTASQSATQDIVEILEEELDQVNVDVRNDDNRQRDIINVHFK